MKNERRCMLSCIACLLVIAGCAIYQTKTIYVLLFLPEAIGMFPRADSYQLLDEAFASFEKKHPNVDVQYVSGIRVIRMKKASRK